MTSPPPSDETNAEMNAASLTTAPREETAAESAVTLPKLGAIGMLRWAWRQLTSMRVALILLFMLSLAAAEKALKAKRFRVVRGADANGGGWVSGEKGYLREVGNLVFHLSLVGILAGFAIKGFYGVQGKVLINEGESFTNIAQNYDDK